PPEPAPAPAVTRRASQRAAKRPEPEPEPGRPGRPNLWGSAIARGGSAGQAAQGRNQSQPPGPGRGRAPGQPDLMRGGARQTMGDRTIGEVTGRGQESPWARQERGGGRSADSGDLPGRGRTSPQGAGPADDRPSFARGSQPQKPRRFLSDGDEDDFKAAVARTRATRGRPTNDERRQESPPRPPAKKRLPDDWLLE
ncbi:MAG: hypothetical protein ACRDJU_12015, partial [Actinomycetota bacterium]